MQSFSKQLRPRLDLQRIGVGIAMSLWFFTGAVRADPSRLPSEVGWNYGEIETARTMALGGATRAVGSSATGLFTNPANMALSQAYSLDALAQIWPESRRQSYGAAIVDSITSRVAGGLGGSYTAQDPDGLQRKATDVRMGLAYPVSDKIFVGLAGRYLRVRQDGLGPLGPSYASGGLQGTPVVNAFSVDAGLTVKPLDLLSIAIVGTNLTNPGHGFLPVGLGGGLGVSTADFSVEGDVLTDFTTFNKTRTRAMAGAEFLAANHFPLRLGYRYDEGLNSHAISGGVGYIEQQFGLEVSMRRVVSGDKATAIVIGFQYVLDAGGSRGRSTVESE